MNDYYDWKGNRINVTVYRVNPGSRHGWTEYAVKRTLKAMPDWLHAEFETVQFADGWQSRDAYERNCWIHLYDAVLCETVAPFEASEAIHAGRVFSHLTARASNYMHTVQGRG